MFSNKSFGERAPGASIKRLEDKWQLIPDYLRVRGLVRQHIDSFDHFLREEIHKIIKSNRVVKSTVDGKVIIWANYRHDIRTITKELEKKYGKSAVANLYGDTPVDDRDQIISDFQDKEAPLTFLVANPKTGGYGLTLTASHTVIYYSNNYDLETRLQSEDRVHRIGQKSKVTYIDLIVEKTVDEQIVKSLRNKIDIATQVLGEDLKKWLI